MKKLFRVIPDTDMRCRHQGLLAQALAAGVKKKDLKAGDILAFINGAKDRVMALAILEEEDSYHVLGYYRSPHGRVAPESIEFIAEAFGADGLDMDQAIRKGLEKLLGNRRARKITR